MSLVVISFSHHEAHKDTRRESHEVALPIGTAFHERTFALCHSLNYREWSGYYTVSVYEVHHEHEYNAIRNACALIDISPLYKYLVTGKDATKLVNRVITRDINKVAVGQVIYACWCDEEGKVIDDGTITRLEENKYRWTAADPSLRWFRQNGSEYGCSDRRHLRANCGFGAAGARFRETSEDGCRSRHREPEIFPQDERQDCRRAGGYFAHRIHRRPWLRNLDSPSQQWDDAVKVWDALMDKGKQFDIHAAGMLALDVARVEAGLLLIEVDYISSKKALIPSQKYSPYELGFGKMVHLEKENFIGKRALARDNQQGVARQLVGLEVDWVEVEEQFDKFGLSPAAPSQASRVAVPVYDIPATGTWARPQRPHSLRC